MSKISFLVVDGSNAVQTFIRRLLEGYGFAPDSIKTTSDPQYAAGLVADLNSDFLLTDWFAKDALDGIELFDLIKEFNPACQFALLSNEVTPEHQRRADAAGALFLLAKPFTADALRTALGEAIDRLVKTNPKIASYLSARSTSKTQKPVEQPRVPAITQYRQGERVRFQGSIATVKYVILRRGELVLQLTEHPGFMIPAEKVERLAWP